MGNISHKILKKLKVKREMTLQEVLMILPKKHKDHRDIYPFVNLITGGYIDSEINYNGKDIFHMKSRKLAITLHTASFGKGKSGVAASRRCGPPFTRRGSRTRLTFR